MDKEDIKWLISLLVSIVLTIWTTNQKLDKGKEPKKHKRRKRK